MTFVKDQAKLGLALLVAVLMVIALAACEDPNGVGDDPGTDPGVEDPGADPGAEDPGADDGGAGF